MRIIERFIAGVVGCSVACASMGCKRQVSPEPSGQVGATGATVGYPLGKWRLAPFEEVNRTVLWVSHIVIAHKESVLDDPSMRPPGWRPDPPTPSRSRGEALDLAVKIAERAARDPASFAELARQFSDDVVTKDHGGSLGGVRAGQLSAEYRDALATMKPGETSRVIQTAFGFHVIQRRPMPAEQMVSGRRIVIRYKGTVGGPPGAQSDRARDAAARLANDLTQKARAGVESFDACVKAYSENADAAQLGDMGSWSVRDPGFLPREVERLGELQVGEIADPIDGVFGFEILERTGGVERPRYAMTAVGVRYDPSAPADHDDSRAIALRTATDLADVVGKDPGRFDALRHERCCEENQAWTQGRGPLGVEAALQGLAIGEIAKTPVDAGWILFIPRRLDPGTVPDPPAPIYELPNPRGPNFEDLVQNMDGLVLPQVTRLFASETERAFRGRGGAYTKLPKHVYDLAANFERDAADPKRRVDDLHDALTVVRTELGSGFPDFDGFLKDWGTRVVLQQLGGAPRLGGKSPLVRPSKAVRVSTASN